MARGLSLLIDVIESELDAEVVRTNVGKKSEGGGNLNDVRSGLASRFEDVIPGQRAGVGQVKVYIIL